MILILLALFIDVAHKQGLLELMTNIAVFAFIYMGNKHFLFFSKKNINLNDLLDCKDTVRIIDFECNQLVFLLLVHIP